MKPEFFGHEGLFDLERRTGLPLRLAFAGLWTVCDREGRFVWRPRTLKRDVLPYDDLDFGAVLAALAEGGFVHRYSADGDEFGHVPSWEKHQKPHHKEPPSSRAVPTCCDGQFMHEPSTDDASAVDNSSTYSDSVSDADSSGSKTEVAARARRKPKASDADPYPPDFSAWWALWPQQSRVGKREAAKVWSALSEADRLLAASAVRAQAVPRGQLDPEKPAAPDGASRLPHPRTWLNQRRFEDEAAQAPASKAREGYRSAAQFEDRDYGGRP